MTGKGDTVASLLRLSDALASMRPGRDDREGDEWSAFVVGGAECFNEARSR